MVFFILIFVLSNYKLFAEKIKACDNLEAKLSKRERTIIEKEADIEKRIATNQGLERVKLLN